MSDIEEEAEVSGSGGGGERANAVAEKAAAAGPASMASATEEQPTLGPAIALGAVALVGVGALGIYLALRPDGESVGEVDLLDPGSTLAIDGQAGDEVSFVSRVTTGLGAYDGSSWKGRSSDATRAMKGSTLTVVVVGPDGAEQTSRCPLWGGSMSSARPDDEHLTENGVINDCGVALRSAGEHMVRASVQWDHTLQVTEARLTVHRKRSAR